MKNSYISCVRRKLTLPHDKKKEVMRDLEDIFATAKERGESEAETISRLGAPDEYARETEAAFGVDGARLRRKRLAVFAFAFAFVAVVAFAFGVAAGYGVQRVPEGAIGYAESMTDIEVEGEGFDVYPAALGAGAVAACAAIALGIAATVTRKRKQ